MHISVMSALYFVMAEEMASAFMSSFPPSLLAGELLMPTADLILLDPVTSPQAMVNGKW